MIYRQPVEAMETANVALSGNGGVHWDEANSVSSGVQVSPIKAPHVVTILNPALNIRSVNDFISVCLTTKYVMPLLFMFSRLFPNHPPPLSVHAHHKVALACPRKRNVVAWWRSEFQLCQLGYLVSVCSISSKMDIKRKLNSITSLYDISNEFISLQNFAVINAVVTEHLYCSTLG